MVSTSLCRSGDGVTLVAFESRDETPNGAFHDYLRSAVQHAVDEALRACGRTKADHHPKCEVHNFAVAHIFSKWWKPCRRR